MEERKRSYQSRRRKRGAQPGNRNAEGTIKYIEKALENEEAGELSSGEETITGSGLDVEIQMLRGAMRELDRVRKQATTAQEKIKATQIMSLVGERLATMLLIQRKLGGSVDEFEQMLQDVSEEILQEKGWTSEDFK